MATATETAPTEALPAFKPIINNDRDHHANLTEEFDAEKHLAFKPPSQVIKMKEIDHHGDYGVSPVAVSQPFQLFSEGAIRQMRNEIFKPEVLEKCKFKSDIAASQLRGYAPKYGPFTYDAWTNPQTLSLISGIAGIDLVPAIDLEIGHINLSVKSEEQTRKEIDAIDRQKRFFEDDEGISGCPWEDDKPIVGWHTDSYPFVVVLMLSDCTNMVGGETALKTGTGEVLKVRGPGMGCAVVMQGRYITHQALRALGAQERITSVTSFRARCPFKKDDVNLTTVRPISNLSDLYLQFGEYRLEMMEERIREQLKQVREKLRSGKPLNIGAFKDFLKEQSDFLSHTNEEIIESRETIQEKLMEATGEINNLPNKRAKLA